MSLGRFFVKLVKTYVVYDRATGMIVGETIVGEEVVKRVLKTKGLHYDERIEAADAKIPLGAEDMFHQTVAKLRYSSVIDKEVDAAIEKAAKKT